jgi:hypothetical protein
MHLFHCYCRPSIRQSKKSRYGWQSLKLLCFVKRLSLCQLYSFSIFCLRTYLHYSTISSIYIIYIVVSAVSVLWSRSDLGSLSFRYARRFKPNAAKCTPRTAPLMGFNLYSVANISTLMTSYNFSLLPAWFCDQMLKVQHFESLLSDGLLTIAFTSE